MILLVNTIIINLENTNIKIAKKLKLFV